MLPATIVRSPAARHIAPAISVTVLLPLEPVMASTLTLAQRRQRLREQLDVAHHRHAALRSLRNGRLAQGDARTDGDQVHAGEVFGSERARGDGHLRQLARKLRGGRRRLARVGHAHARALARQPARHRQAAHAQPQHQYLFACQIHSRSLAPLLLNRRGAEAQRTRRERPSPVPQNRM